MGQFGDLIGKSSKGKTHLKKGKIIKELKDYTTFFNSYLIEGSRMEKVFDFGFNCMQVGQGGGGKTVMMVIFASKIIKNDQRFNLCLLKTSPEVIELFENKIKTFKYKTEKEKEENYKLIGHIKTAQDLKDIPPFSFVAADEAAITNSLYEWNTPANKRIVKDAAVTRHRSSILWMNAQDFSFIKKFASKCQLTLYKQCSDDYLSKTKDKFEKMYSNILRTMRLDKRKTVFRSSVDGMTGYRDSKTNELVWNPKSTSIINEGVFYFDMNDEIPWFDKECSKYWEKFGITDESNIEKYEKIMQCAIEIKDNVCTEKEFVSAAKGYFLSRDWLYHLNEYEDLVGLIPDACNVAKYLRDNPNSDYAKEILSKLKDLKNSEEKEDVEIDGIEPSLSEDEMENISKEIDLSNQTFPEYVQRHYSDKPFEASLFYRYLMGVRSTELRSGKNGGNVAELIHLFTQNEQGYIFEDYINQILKTGYESAHNEHRPDVIFNNRIISCKSKIKAGRKYVFNIDTDFVPELNYCIQNNIPEYDIIYFNPYWADGKCRIITLQTTQHGLIEIKKDSEIFNPSKYGELYGIESNVEMENEGETIEMDGNS